eukprot:1194326-Prorocentrum_minimum.AAC.3
MHRGTCVGVLHRAHAQGHLRRGAAQGRMLWHVGACCGTLAFSSSITALSSLPVSDSSPASSITASSSLPVSDSSPARLLRGAAVSGWFASYDISAMCSARRNIPSASSYLCHDKITVHEGHKRPKCQLHEGRGGMRRAVVRTLLGIELDRTGLDWTGITPA